MSSVAIITARGGSKRIPRKNIREFCGKPIIAYSIEAAIEANIFDEVMISTDNIEIAEVAKIYGAKVPFFRSKENSDDFSTTSDVLQEVLLEYQKSGRNFDKACCIYPTAPFITADKIIHAMDILQEGVDTIIPVVGFSYPPQRGLVLRNDLLQMREPENKRVRSQDLETMYHDAGQFYCFNVASFFKAKDLMSGNIKPLFVDEMEVQDIDNESDWKIAEIKYKFMAGQI